MAKMTWDAVGERFYRTGVEQVALFVWDPSLNSGAGGYGTGVAWNGVTSIEENPDGGDANDFYADNIKYLSLRAVEDYDTEGVDHGYELHIVYNATASPSSKNYETINDSPEPAELSWDIETTPIAVTGHKPTSHIVISSLAFTGANASKLTAINDYIYGTAGTADENQPHLPSPAKLLELIA